MQKTFNFSILFQCFAFLVVLSPTLAIAQNTPRPVKARPGEFLLSFRSKTLPSPPNQSLPAQPGSQLAAATSGGEIVVLADNLLFVRLTSTTPPISAHLAGAGEVGPVENLTSALAEQFAIDSSDIEITPNYVGVLAKEPNDTKYAVYQRDYLQQIHMIDAWDQQTDAADIIVAVLDSGIMYTHEDLVGNIWTDPVTGLVGKDFYDKTSDPQAKFLGTMSYTDELTERCIGNDMLRRYEQHGTRVASIIGGIGNNALGTAGIAWKVKIMPLRVAEDRDTCSAVDLRSVVDGIRFAVDHGAKIINGSWTGFPDVAPLRDALQYASDHDVLFVTAAGNDGLDRQLQNAYPANYAFPNMIVVASVTSAGALSSFSGFGPNIVDIAAPGERIEGAVPSAYRTLLSSEYSYDNGTSFSAPIVTGLAALLRSYKSSLTAPEIKSLIVGTAETKASLQGKVRAGGVVNAMAALTAASSATPASLATFPTTPANEIVAVSEPSQSAVLAAASPNSNYLSSVTIKNLMSFLATLPITSGLDEGYIATLIPLNSDTTKEEHLQLAKDIAEQLRTAPRATYASDEKDRYQQKIIIERARWTDAGSVRQHVNSVCQSQGSALCNAPPQDIDAQTMELSIERAADINAVVRDIENQPGVKAYRSPVGVLK